MRIRSAQPFPSAGVRCQATQIVGHALTTPTGECLGSIEDLVLDRTAPKVIYAVVACGGALGLGARHLAIPWRLLDIRCAERGQPTRVHVHIARTALARENAPMERRGPGASPTRWGTLMHLDWHRRSRAKGRSGARAGERHRIGEYLGAVVQDAHGRRLARIADAWIDLGTGTVAHLVLRHGGTFGRRAQCRSVPTLDLTFVGRHLVCADTAASMATAPALGGNATGHAMAAATPFDPTRGFGGVEVRVRGTIVTMGTATAAPGVQPHMRLRLWTDSGEVVVRAGIGTDSHRAAAWLRDGRSIEVRGWRAMQGDRTVLVATSIRAGNRSIHIAETPRDEISIPQ